MQNNSRQTTTLEAARVFGDSLGITVSDADPSLAEDQYITVGVSSRGRMLIVAHTERGERICIISAWELTRAETNLVLLAPDVAKAFSNDAEAVNETLRLVIQLKKVSAGKEQPLAKP